VGCEGCRAFLEEERAFDLRLAGLAAPVPASDVWVAVRTATRRRRLVFRLFATPKRVLAAAVALASVAAALLIVPPIAEKRAEENQVVIQQVFIDQAQSQVAQKWIDDPLGSTTDRVVAAIEEEL